MLHCVEQQLSERLKHSPDTIEDLAIILGTIANIRDMSPDVEMRFTDVQERYRTQAMYKVEVWQFNFTGFNTALSHLLTP